MEKYLYICTSPLLTTYKIGFHNGTPYALFKRYQTALGEQVEFVMFRTPKPEEHEVILHRILQPYRENNEHFKKDPEIFYMYCYMAKAVTGCEKVGLYSRRKYGYLREKAKWQYEKSERDDESQLNEIIHGIEKHGNINLAMPQDELVNIFNKMNIDDNVEDMEVDEKMIDNPFGRFAFVPAKSQRDGSIRKNLYALR